MRNVGGRQRETCDLLSKWLELENSKSAQKELIKNGVKVLGKADFTEVTGLCVCVCGVNGLWGEKKGSQNMKIQKNLFF